MNQKPNVRIVIADDHWLVRKGIKETLRNDRHLELVGEATNGAELLEIVKLTKPDIVITDIKMPVMDGIAAVKEIKKILPETGIIALTAFDRDYDVLDMFEAGAYGYLLKESDDRQIIDAVFTVHNKEPFCPVFNWHMIRKLLANNPKKYVQHVPVLKDAERKIIRGICEGKQNKHIAYDLGLKLKTIINYRKKLMEKLEKNNVASLIMYAVQTGLFEVPEEPSPLGIQSITKRIE